VYICGNAHIVACTDANIDAYIDAYATVDLRHLPMPEKSPQQSFSSDEAWQLILQTLKSLNDKPALNEHKKTIIAEAVAALKDLTKAEKYPRYAEFLHRTLHDAGGGGVLVCAVALGQTRVVRMRNKERVSLLGKIKENPRIFGDSNITLLVVHHGVPRSMKGAKTDPQLLQQLTIRSQSCWTLLGKVTKRARAESYLQQTVQSSLET